MSCSRRSARISGRINSPKFLGALLCDGICRPQTSKFSDSRMPSGYICISWPEMSGKTNSLGLPERGPSSTSRGLDASVALCWVSMRCSSARQFRASYTSARVTACPNSTEDSDATRSSSRDVPPISKKSSSGCTEERFSNWAQRAQSACRRCSSFSVLPLAFAE